MTGQLGSYNPLRNPPSWEGFGGLLHEFRLVPSARSYPRMHQANLQAYKPSGNQTESEDFVGAGAAHVAFDAGGHMLPWVLSLAEGSD